MIRLKHVHKYFNRNKSNEIHVINDTSLELPENGIVALLGPSGGGKTTLLNAIGGLDRVDSGQIYIDDVCLTKLRRGKIDELRNAAIGYIFQNFNLLDQETVFENVALVLRMIGIKDKDVIKERVDYCLRAVGIYSFRHKTAEALSGGQRQRVAIARAIAKNPRIIIADEPTGNLDSANTIEVMNIIKTISKERLVLLVTHECKIAEFYASRIVELQDGRIISDRPNDTEKLLDYQLENKLYLKDFSLKEEVHFDKASIELYGDDIPESKIRIVVRGGNLFVDTGGRFQVVDDADNMEMIDAHYEAMDESIYEANGFRYDAHLPEGYRARYASLFNPWRSLKDGFKKIASFRPLRKFLLVGFFFAAVFAYFALSESFGALDIRPEDYKTTSDHYLTVPNASHTETTLNNLASVEGVEYVIPGTSQVSVDFMLDDYWQTNDAAATQGASAVRLSSLNEDSVILGEKPSDANGIVVDKLLIDMLHKSKIPAQIGIYEDEEWIGRKVKIADKTFTIRGISNHDSPEIFLPDGQVNAVITTATEKNPAEGSQQYFGFTAQEEDADEATKGIKDYADRADIKITKGSAPDSDYEVLVNQYHEGEAAIGKTVGKRVGNTSLTVSGYYESSNPMLDDYYVTSHTMLLQKIANSDQISVYVTEEGEKEAVIDRISELGYDVKDNDARDLAAYRSENLKQLRSYLIAAGVMLAVAMAEIYLMMRSSFLSRIKEISTMRAIGVKKRDIYQMFMGEIIAITLITSIPGIWLGRALAVQIVEALPTMAGNFMNTPAVAVITFLLLLAFNLLIGLAPLYRMMRKTPAEMLSRTDI